VILNECIFQGMSVGIGVLAGEAVGRLQCQHHATNKAVFFFICMHNYLHMLLLS
jgi:hypothetical protein